MSTSLHARLVNARKQVTLHHCVRLEVRGEGLFKGICPIYQGTDTEEERVFNSLRAGANSFWLKRLFPNVELIRVEPETTTNERAA